MQTEIFAIHLRSGHGSWVRLGMQVFLFIHWIPFPSVCVGSYASYVTSIRVGLNSNNLLGRKCRKYHGAVGCRNELKLWKGHAQRRDKSCLPGWVEI
ncbi:hypothetical protein D9M69_713790 [compost metagenome]